MRRARMRLRHFGVFFTFWLCIALPVAVSGWYLFERAADQFASRVGFSVRTQDRTGAVDIFDGLGSLAGNTSSDADILYEFIHSQEMVERVDARLDLRGATG